MRRSHESFESHVRRANPATPHAVYIHSWNPSLGALIDSLYRPRWSLHEAPAFAPRDRVRSAAESLRRALAAMDAATPRAELVAAMRHDLLWFADLRIDELPRAQLWLLSMCCAYDPTKVWQALVSRSRRLPDPAHPSLSSDARAPTVRRGRYGARASATASVLDSALTPPRGPRRTPRVPAPTRASSTFAI